MTINKQDSATILVRESRPPELQYSEFEYCYRSCCRAAFALSRTGCCCYSTCETEICTNQVDGTDKVHQNHLRASFQYLNGHILQKHEVHVADRVMAAGQARQHCERLVECLLLLVALSLLGALTSQAAISCPGLSNGSNPAVCTRQCQLSVCQSLSDLYKVSNNQSNPWRLSTGWSGTATQTCKQLTVSLTEAASAAITHCHELCTVSPTCCAMSSKAAAHLCMLWYCAACSRITPP